jgi:hypothetical protein
MHDDKVALQPRLEGMCEKHRRHSRPAMQEENDRLRAIASSNENPLLDSPDPLFLK